MLVTAFSSMREGEYSVSARDICVGGELGGCAAEGSAVFF